MARRRGYPTSYERSATRALHINPAGWETIEVPGSNWASREIKVIGLRKKERKGLAKASASGPFEIARFVSSVFQSAHEILFAIHVDNMNKINAVQAFEGTIDQAHVYPRNIVEGAILSNASGVALCHNHPGGSLTPSPADRSLTETIRAALDAVGIRFLDHIILGGKPVSSGGNYYFSFRERGYL